MSKEANKRKQDFLLTFFNGSPEYQTKEVNGFLLVKHINGDTKNWEVAIFTPESYKKSQENKLF